MSFPEELGTVIEVPLSITIAELNSDGSSSCPHYSLASLANTYVAENRPDIDMSAYQHRSCEAPLDPLSWEIFLSPLIVVGA